MQSLSTILRGDDQRADRVALWCAGKEWTYAALDILFARLSAGLRAAGFGPQTLLGTLLPNSTEQLALHLAAFRLGVPLVRLNAGYAAPQLEYCLRQTQPLAAYMVPDRIHFVRRLPMHATGKLDRERLWMMGEVSEFDESLL